MGGHSAMSPMNQGTPMTGTMGYSDHNHEPSSLPFYEDNNGFCAAGLLNEFNSHFYNLLDEYDQQISNNGNSIEQKQTFYSLAETYPSLNSLPMLDQYISMQLEVLANLGAFEGASIQQLNNYIMPTYDAGFIARSILQFMQEGGTLMQFNEVGIDFGMDKTLGLDKILKSFIDNLLGPMMEKSFSFFDENSETCMNENDSQSVGFCQCLQQLAGNAMRIMTEPEKDGKLEAYRSTFSDIYHFLEMLYNDFHHESPVFFNTEKIKNLMQTEVKNVAMEVDRFVQGMDNSYSTDFLNGAIRFFENFPYSMDGNGMDHEEYYEHDMDHHRQQRDMHMMSSPSGEPEGEMGTGMTPTWESELESEMDSSDNNKLDMFFMHCAEQFHQFEIEFGSFDDAFTSLTNSTAFAEFYMENFLNLLDYQYEHDSHMEMNDNLYSTNTNILNLYWYTFPGPAKSQDQTTPVYKLASFVENFGQLIDSQDSKDFISYYISPLVDHFWSNCMEKENFMNNFVDPMINTGISDFLDSEHSSKIFGKMQAMMNQMENHDEHDMESENYDYDYQSCPYQSSFFHPIFDPEMGYLPEFQRKYFFTMLGNPEFMPTWEPSFDTTLILSLDTIFEVDEHYPHDDPMPEEPKPESGRPERPERPLTGRPPKPEYDYEEDENKKCPGRPQDLTLNINFNGMEMKMKRERDGEYHAYHQKPGTGRSPKSPYHENEMDEQKSPKEYEKEEYHTYEREPEPEKESAMQSMMLSTLLLKLDDMQMKFTEKIEFLSKKLEENHCAAPEKMEILDEEPSVPETLVEPEKEEEEVEKQKPEFDLSLIRNEELLKTTFKTFENTDSWDIPKIYEELETCLTQGLKSCYQNNNNKEAINNVFPEITKAADFSDINNLVENFNYGKVADWMGKNVKNQCQKQFSDEAKKANNLYKAVKITGYQCQVYVEKMFGVLVEEAQMSK